METGEELEGGAGRENDTNMGLRWNFQEINFKKKIKQVFMYVLK